MKYKDGKKELSTNLYSLLPETEEIKFAKAVTELQSEVGGRPQRVTTCWSNSFTAACSVS